MKRTAIALLFMMGVGNCAYYFATLSGWRLLPREPLLAVVRVTGDIIDTSTVRADRVIPALTAAYEAEDVKAVAILRREARRR